MAIGELPEDRETPGQREGDERDLIDRIIDRIIGGDE